TWPSSSATQTASAATARSTSVRHASTTATISPVVASNSNSSVVPDPTGAQRARPRTPIGPTPAPGRNVANVFTRVRGPPGSSLTIRLAVTQVPAQTKRSLAVSELTAGTRTRSTTLFVAGSIRAIRSAPAVVQMAPAPAAIANA